MKDTTNEYSVETTMNYKWKKLAAVQAAVLLGVFCQFFGFGSVACNRPPGAHAGHAYFEQPCCGRSHLRHHKDIQKLKKKQ